MKAEAKANEEADKQAKERVEKMNAADQLVFQTEKQLSEYGDKLPEEKKAVIESAKEALKEAHKSEDLDRIESASKELNDAWAAASEELYKAAQEAQAEEGASGETASSEGGEDVQDVEFEEVDESEES